MTILQSLVSYHERLSNSSGEDTPGYGFSSEKISYAIVLSPEGGIVDRVPLLDTSGKKPRPSSRLVPRPVPRTSGVASNFMWDKSAYVLGVKRDRTTKEPVLSRKEYEDFRKFHQEMLADTNDTGLRALLAFLEQWEPERYHALPFDDAEEMVDTNLVFRLDGKSKSFLHERDAARRIWLNHLAQQGGETGLCMITGETAPIARLHPVIKGVRGGQSSGTNIVSFNQDAFTSFDRKQGDNAPVSEEAAAAYTTALNHLLQEPGTRIFIGDTTVAFWAIAEDERTAAAAEGLFAALTEPPSTDEQETIKLADVLQRVRAGRPLKEIAPGLDEKTSFHILGLAPNASRLSIRFYHTNTIGEIARRIVQHWEDLHLDPEPWKTPPSARRLLYETAVQRKAENIPPILGGGLMHAIFTGQRYPRSLLAVVVERMRADKDINGIRAAICKACLARDHRLGINTEMEVVPVSLNRDEPNPAYRLGRLFAVYENVQRAALGRINATIKDRYYGAASATPAAVFPMLIKNSAHHLSSLRKGGKSGGLAHWFNQEIDSILDGIDTAFPRSLRLEDQGRFALGYHHQRASARKGGALEDDDSTDDDQNQEE